MKMKYLIIATLLLLASLTACRSLQNEGGTDWAIVELSIAGSDQGSGGTADRGMR